MDGMTVQDVSRLLRDIPEDVVELLELKFNYHVL